MAKGVHRRNHMASTGSAWPAPETADMCVRGDSQTAILKSTARLMKRSRIARSRLRAVFKAESAVCILFPPRARADCEGGNLAVAAGGWIRYHDPQARGVRTSEGRHFAAGFGECGISQDRSDRCRVQRSLDAGEGPGPSAKVVPAPAR